MLTGFEYLGEIHFHLPMMIAASYDLDPALYFQLEYSQLPCNIYPVKIKNSVFTGNSIIENPYDQIQWKSKNIKKIY